jgi:hypothetical protein
MATSRSSNPGSAGLMADNDTMSTRAFMYCSHTVLLLHTRIYSADDWDATGALHRPRYSHVWDNRQSLFRFAPCLRPSANSSMRVGASATEGACWRHACTKMTPISDPTSAECHRRPSKSTRPSCTRSPARVMIPGQTTITISVIRSL